MRAGVDVGVWLAHAAWGTASVPASASVNSRPAQLFSASLFSSLWSGCNRQSLCGHSVDSGCTDLDELDG